MSSICLNGVVFRIVGKKTIRDGRIIFEAKAINSNGRIVRLELIDFKFHIIKD